jgi:hypothetical protein
LEAENLLAGQLMGAKRSTCKVANFFFATFFLFGKEKS